MVAIRASILCKRPRLRGRRRSTIRSNPNVTVYNSDIALIRDVPVSSSREDIRLSFMDIAATVNPATVHFRESLSEPSRSRAEQNYEYDLLEPEKLLRKYVGRDVTLVRTRQVNGTTEEEEVTARLLSYNNQPVWRINGEIVTGLHADHIRFPELPDTLFTRPTLIWTLDNGGVPRPRVELRILPQAVVERRRTSSPWRVTTKPANRRMGDADPRSGTRFGTPSCNWWPASSIALRESFNR